MSCLPIGVILMRTQKIVFVVSIIAMMSVLTAMSHAETYVLNPDGTGDAPNIQAALEVSEDGDVIELTDGTYIGEGYYNIDFLGKAVTIRSQSGNVSACILTLESVPEDRRAFILQSNEGASSVLEGLTFQGWSSEFGSGVVIKIVGAMPTIRGCVFHSNGSGSAISAVSNSNPLIENCVFSNNIDYSMGSLAAAMSLGAATVRGCTFISNWAQSSGALSCGSSEVATTVEDCVFLFNNAMEGQGGAVRVNSAGGVEFVRCTFYRNTSFTEGAAIIGHGPFSVNNCIFMNCSSYLFDNHNVPVVVGPVTFACTDIFGNPGGDWVGDIADQVGINGNISADPQFCGQGDGNYYLQSDSPCAPDNNSCSIQIGAFGVGCNTTASESMTWSEIKALY